MFQKGSCRKYPVFFTKCILCLRRSLIKEPQMYEMHPLLTPFPYQGTSNVGKTLFLLRNYDLNFTLQ